MAAGTSDPSRQRSCLSLYVDRRITVNRGLAGFGVLAARTCGSMGLPGVARGLSQQSAAEADYTCRHQAGVREKRTSRGAQRRPPATPVIDRSFHATQKTDRRLAATDLTADTAGPAAYKKPGSNGVPGGRRTHVASGSFTRHNSKTGVATSVSDSCTRLNFPAGLRPPCLSIGVGSSGSAPRCQRIQHHSTGRLYERAGT